MRGDSVPANKTWAGQPSPGGLRAATLALPWAVTSPATSRPHPEWRTDDDESRLPPRLQAGPGPGPGEAALPLLWTDEGPRRTHAHSPTHPTHVHTRTLPPLGPARSRRAAATSGTAEPGAAWPARPASPSPHGTAPPTAQIGRLSHRRAEKLTQNHAARRRPSQGLTPGHRARDPNGHPFLPPSVASSRGPFPTADDRGFGWSTRLRPTLGCRGGGGAGGCHRGVQAPG